MPRLIRFISFNFLTHSGTTAGRFVAPFKITVMLCVMVMFVIANNVNADERVYTYSSTIKVLQNRSLDVTETITVNVENVKILHGIHWDFETTHINQNNNKVKVDLKIISLKRNGETEPYHSKKQGNVIRVFFGSKKKLVSKGIQTYTLRYIASNKLNSYKNKDEFYWNASGNKWSMPIFRVEATLILPKGVNQRSIHFNAYSGYTGVNKQDYISTFTNNHTINFALNRKYLIGDGLTIAIDWPSGYIDAPSAAAKNISVADSRSLPLDFTAKKINLIKPEVIVEEPENVAFNSASAALKNDNRVIEKPLLETVKKAVAQLKEAEQKSGFNQGTTDHTITNISSNDSNIPTADNELSSEPAKVTVLLPIAAAKFLTEPDNLAENNATTLDFSDIMSKKISSYLQYKLTSNNLYTLLGVLLLLSYFLITRLYLNNSRKKRTINNDKNDATNFDDLSPAAIRYINEMGYDDRTFAIALINIAVKGHIDIIKKENYYNIERRDFSSADPLSEDETLLLNTLMGKNSKIKLTAKNHEIIHDAMTQHQNQLEKEHRTKYFIVKGNWFNISIVFLTLILFAVAYTEEQPIQTVLVFSLIGLFSLMTFLLSYLVLELTSFYKSFKISVITDSAAFTSMLETKEAYIFAAIAIQTGLLFLGFIYLDTINIISIALASFVCAIFSEYLNVNNIERESILNKIVNLRDSITHAEALQENTQYDSVELSQKIIAFDNYLPYTIALGVESEWGDHYSLLFDHKDNDELIGYSPHWYHDSNWIENNTTGFCESLSSKFSAAAAAKFPDTGFTDVATASKTKH